MRGRHSSIEALNRRYIGGPVGGVVGQPISTIATGAPITRVSALSPARVSAVRVSTVPTTTVVPTTTYVPTTTVVPTPYVPVVGTALAAPTNVVVRRSVVRGPAVTETAVTPGPVQAVTRTTTVQQTTIPNYVQVVEEDVRIPDRILEDPRENYNCKCPWWLCCLALLPLLLLLGLGLFKWLGGAATTDVTKREETTTEVVTPVDKTDEGGNEGGSEQTKTEIVQTGKWITRNKTKVVPAHKCSAGFFFFNGQCMKCPPGSGWNSTHCVQKKVITKTTEQVREVDPTPVETYGSTLTANSLSSESELFTGFGGGQSSGFAEVRSASSSGSAGSSGSSSSSSWSSSSRSTGDLQRQPN